LPCPSGSLPEKPPVTTSPHAPVSRTNRRPRRAGP
jgi:hypothetical protein